MREETTGQRVKTTKEKAETAVGDPEQFTIA
jgi:hypothetical protein